MDGYPHGDTTSDQEFWREVFAIQGSITPQIIFRASWFGAIALVIFLVDKYLYPLVDLQLTLYEIAGAVLGVLLVFRTNAGYDRWYEARKLLGGMVNETRNLAVTCLIHGPADQQWRYAVTRWIASFAHACRTTLRGEPLASEVRTLVGVSEFENVSASVHPPTAIALRIGQYLRRAQDEGQLSATGFLRADQERALLIDHQGACERILKTPIPWVYSVNIRRLIFLYLASTPFALIDSLGWFTPLMTILVSYPVLSVDQIGVELQNPFNTKSLSHLPIDRITAGIERDILGIYAECVAASN